jgi:hypothetical protein
MRSPSLTIPRMRRSSLMTGTALIRRSRKRAAMALTGMSGPTDTTFVVMTSFAFIGLLRVGSRPGQP